MRLSYREFEGTDADYELLAEIESTVGDGPKTPEQLRHRDEQWKSDRFRVREFILADEKCVGTDTQYKAAESEDDTNSLFFTLLPAFRGRGLDEAILENLIDKARNRGVAKVWTNCRDEDEGRILALERLGFTFFTSFVESKLDLDRFDPGPLALRIQRVEELGITIRSADALSRNGRDWIRLQYDWKSLYLAEEHPGEPQQIGAFEEYREEAVNSATRFPAGEYAAFEGETCVGITSVTLADDEPETADTALTYVGASYRRKGVATALKLASLSAAKQGGIRLVRTVNKGHIPMLQLNIRLGFEKVDGILCYWKTIAAK